MAKSKKDFWSAYDAAVADLEKDYKTYRNIYVNGSSDAVWADSVGLDLKLNHILRNRGRVAEMCGDRFDLYPLYYFIPIPPRLPFPQQYHAFTRFNNPNAYYPEYRGTDKSVYTIDTPYEDIMSFAPKEYEFTEITLP